MELRKKLRSLCCRAIAGAQEKNHRLAEKNRLKAAIPRAEAGRDRAYASLGRYYYATGSADENSEKYFERIERSTERIEKARAGLREYAQQSRRKTLRTKKQAPQIPPQLKLELETEAIVAQIERETDELLLPKKPQPQDDPEKREQAELLKAISAPTQEQAEECALENDRNVPWD